MLRRVTVLCVCVCVVSLHTASSVAPSNMGQPLSQTASDEPQHATANDY